MTVGDRVSFGKNAEMVAAVIYNSIFKIKFRNNYEFTSGEGNSNPVQY